MHKLTQHQLSFLAFDLFIGAPSLRHGFSLRRQVLAVPDSQPAQVDFDLSNSSGPVAKDSAERFAGVLGLSDARLVRPQQVHSNRVAVVDDTYDISLGVDAVCTDLVGMALMLVGADCPVVMVYDPQRPALGLAHAGWRGTVGRITTRLVETMVLHFGSDPADMLAGIGPGICGRCYEVSSDVAHQAQDSLDGADEFILPLQQSSPHSPRWLFDLALANRRQLLQADLHPANIESADLCTLERPDWFYSYRRDQTQTGRCALLAGLTSP